MKLYVHEFGFRLENKKGLSFTFRLCWGRCCSFYPGRRHGSTRVPGHAFRAWRSSWQKVLYSYYITAAGNSFCSQLGSSCAGQPVQYGNGRRYGPSIIYKITPAGSLSSSRSGRAAIFGQPSSLRLWLIASTCPNLHHLQSEWSLISVYILGGGGGGLDITMGLKKNF
jgi:hypothetical protein